MTEILLNSQAQDGKSLNIGSGEPISVVGVAEALARTLGSDVHSELTGKYRAGDIRHCFADISAAHACLGYRPRIRFTEGVKEFVQWLQSQRPADRVAEAFEQLNAHGLAA